MCCTRTYHNCPLTMYSLFLRFLANSLVFGGDVTGGLPRPIGRRTAEGVLGSFFKTALRVHRNRTRRSLHSLVESFDEALNVSQNQPAVHQLWIREICLATLKFLLNQPAILVLSHKFFYDNPQSFIKSEHNPFHPLLLQPTLYVQFDHQNMCK